MIKTLLASLSLALLCGCTSVQDPFLTASTVNAPRIAGGSASTSEVAPQFALASLPGLSARTLSIRQNLTAETAVQTIVFANDTVQDGENALTIEVGLAGESGFRQAPSRNDVMREMKAALRGVPMTMTEAMGRNAYGIYGHATGSLPSGGACVYAWQLIKNGQSEGGAPVVGNLMQRKQPVRIRLRYCDAAATPVQLAALLGDLRIKPITSQTLDMLRFASGSSAAASFAPIAPVAATIPAAVRPQPVEVAERPKPRAAAPSVPSPAKAPTPAPIITGAVEVPMPE
ncbi:cellulose biosynthesis protein BcsN [Agrobacterium sp. a22-2]|uniref:cellulose biosynthesis protein BcsN n=1 Tax=Agrobacterium sp. a22-2 TaxID=2283840 RepID=UPI001448926D|nr:cellulose biosynthesis protein BcsN [Agrobacterium sp. a22-2]NKN35600.1 cellulose biosynthesis protein BcsN [Agrobacterium sp. a22-2]